MTIIKSKFTKEFNNILLIPTDFSPRCDNAVKQGLLLAGKLQYKVVILYMIDKSNEEIIKNSPQGEECIGINFHRYIKNFANQSKLEIETLVRKGNIVHGILKVAHELKAGMLIFETDGKHGLEYLFGSHALKLVLHSPCPVIVVQNRSFIDGFRKIVLPVKEDVDPRQAVDWAMILCTLYKSEVKLFLSQETEPSLKTRVKVISNQIARLLAGKNIPYAIETAASPHSFATQVISYATKTNSELIMIITRPDDDFMGLGLSGWDEKIMFNQDQLAVMCINPVIIGEPEIDWMN
jgi:nucleotide-binding universal stress UspA family protein